MNFAYKFSGLPPPGPLSLEDQHRVISSLPIEIQAAMLKKPIQLRTERYVTNHDPTRQLLRNANMVAFRAEPVLISGESGTGKELLARMMLGDRPITKPEREFFPINCAGISPGLFESLLFGHKQGAFTGASKDKPGLLVSAGTGVAFFDEVGELLLDQQAKLLRALQERRVMPVGSDYEVDLRCRFVFATNRDLRAEVSAGRFREDLYYRISALELRTYPLRERGDDAYLIASHSAMPDDPPLECSIPAEIVQSRGNVRALENWLLQRRVFGIGNDGVNPAIGENI